MTIALFTFVAVLYFAPSIIAIGRRHSVIKVCVLNTLFGWNPLGWIASLSVAIE